MEYDGYIQIIGRKNGRTIGRVIPDDPSYTGDVKDFNKIIQNVPTLVADDWALRVKRHAPASAGDDPTYSVDLLFTQDGNDNAVAAVRLTEKQFEELRTDIRKVLQDEKAQN